MTYICINELLRYCHRAAIHCQIPLEQWLMVVVRYFIKTREYARAPAKKKHNYIDIKQRDACYSQMKSSCAFDLSFDS